MRWYLLAFLPILAGCQQKTSAPREKQPAGVPRTTAADDVGRFLAGVPGRPGGPFEDLQKTAAWKSHISGFDHMWAKFERERLPTLQRFQKKEINGGSFTSDVLFYPFGGPDVLTARAFFPNKKIYLLVGLEPPGTLPRTEAIRNANLERYLPAIRRTMDSPLRRSFFITANMDAELRGQITDGVLPVLLVQFARLRCEVLGYQPVTISPKGRLIPRKEEKQPASSRRNDGIALDFRCPGDDVRKLLYFSADLGNDALSANEAFRALLDQMQPVSSFFKSASYLPHRKDFSKVRELVLKHSKAIVQDDTGIPYRLVDQSQWEVRLFGEYTQPYGSYKYMVQPDLRKAYEEKASPIEFRIGYGFGRAPSAVQVFARKT